MSKPVLYRHTKMIPITRIGYAVLSMLARFLPRRVSYLIGETLGTLSFLLSPVRRRNLRINLRVILGVGCDRELAGYGLRVMQNFGRNVVETFLIPHLSPSEMQAKVTVSGKEKIESMMSTGRGVILVTVHLGSWELAGAALAKLGFAMTTVAGTQFTLGLSPLVKAMKERLGIQVVSMDRGALRIVRTLRRGGVVALHLDGDQYMGGVETSFFGRRTTLPRGPAALALRTGAAILPAFAIRTSRQKITIFIEDEIRSRADDELSLTQKAADVAEAYIRRHADQWCMFRPFWGDVE